MDIDTNDWFHIGISSVVPLSDNSSSDRTKHGGLYSRIDIPKNTLLPGFYSGLILSSKRFQELMNDLFGFITKSDMVNMVNEKHSEYDYALACIPQLKGRYGIELESSSSEQSPNWKKIARGIADYAFEIVDWSNEKWDYDSHITVLPTYDYAGNPVFPSDRPGLKRNIYMMANEPPNVKKFYNHFAQRSQKSEANLQAVLPSTWRQEFNNMPHLKSLDSAEERETEHLPPFLKFRTRADIHAGDELFICYGPLYTRNYEINMSADCGCGNYKYMGSILKPGITRVQYNEALKNYDIVPSTLINEDSLRDPVVMRYVNKIHL